MMALGVFFKVFAFLEIHSQIFINEIILCLKFVSKEHEREVGNSRMKQAWPCAAKCVREVMS